MSKLLDKLKEQGLLSNEEAEELNKGTKEIQLRSANRINDTTFERIWKFYYEKTDIELKDKEEEIRRRLINIWALLSDILTDRQAVMAHIVNCRQANLQISERTAYEDLQYAKMLFGDRTKQTKAAQKAIVNEWLVWAINKAKKDNDLKAFAVLIKRYTALNGLENEGAGSVNRPAITINFNSDPETLKKQIDELRRKAEAANAQDIDHKDV